MIPVIGPLVSWFFGGGVDKLVDRAADAYETKLRAETSEQKIAADVDLKRLETMLANAQIAADNKWSATSLGRYLIVLPFGIWWTFTFLDSTFAFSWNTLDLPPRIWSMVEYLIPVIVIGDIGRSFLTRFR